MKAAQVIASSRVGIHWAYTEKLSGLVDSATPTPYREVRKVICNELKCSSPEDLFEFIDPIPVGCASLAQVHRARLKGESRIVALKVQHPRLQWEIPCDVWMLKWCFRSAEFLFPGAKLSFLLRHTREGLAKELDFVAEAQNMERCRNMLKSSSVDCIVPVHFPKLSTERLLTMEYMNGVRISDARKEYRLSSKASQIIARNTVRLFAEMVFLYGFVHCDPHPGNVMVEPETHRLILLDHGLYRELSPGFQEAYVSLWNGLFLRNDSIIESASRDMGSPELSEVFSLLFTQRMRGSWRRTGSTDIIQAFPATWDTGTEPHGANWKCEFVACKSP